MNRETEIVANKQLRKDIDEIVQRVKELPASRERSLAITKLQEGVMWLGMDLKRLNCDTLIRQVKTPLQVLPLNPQQTASNSNINKS